MGAISKKYHRNLAEYFATKPLYLDETTESKPHIRKLKEEPWQLSKAEEWQKLCELLTNFDFGLLTQQNNNIETKTFWSILEANSQYSMLESFEPLLKASKAILERWENPIGAMEGLLHHLKSSNKSAQYQYKINHYISEIATLLNDSGHFDQALILWEFLEDQYKYARDLSNRAHAIGHQIWILRRKGEFKKALELADNMYQISLELPDEMDRLAETFSEKALILNDLQNYREALKFLKKEEKIWRELGEMNDLAKCLGHQALIYRKRNNLEEALNLHEEEERIFRVLGNKDGLQVSLGNRANILILQGRIDEALKLHKEEEILCRELGAKDNLAIVLKNQVSIYNLKSDWFNAKALLVEVLKIYKEVNDQKKINELSDFLHSEALFLKNSQDLEAALALLEEEEILRNEIQNKKKLAICLSEQALILKSKNDFNRALDLLDMAEEIFEDIGDHEDLAATFGNKANLYYILGDLDRSLRLYKKLEDISHTLNDDFLLAKSLANQALIMKDQSNISESILLGKKALKLAKQNNMKSLAREIKKRLGIK